MMSDTFSLIFGVKRHDPGYWQNHPLVAEVEAHFDGLYGWVGLKLNKALETVRRKDTAIWSTAEATRDGPDLHVYGEGECPVALFEWAPRVGRLLVWVEGPIADDERTCWSVGIWLSPD
jgi:hypothetical protein